MRDVVDGGYLSLCERCCCNIGTNVEFCEACLQVVKQCPPKKRFSRAGCIKPRPIIVKPVSSIGLDRLVEVALSPTDMDTTKSVEFSPTAKQLPKVGGLAGHGPGTHSAARSDCQGADAPMGSPHCKSRKSPKPAMVETKALPRYSLPLEAVQKLKRLSSLDGLPQPRSSKVGHGDHSKRFTPRFKSLLDISC